jgi:leucyl aminopeptidase
MGFPHTYCTETDIIAADKTTMVSFFNDVFRQTSSVFLPAGARSATRPIWMLGNGRAGGRLSERHQAWVNATEFKPRPGSVLLVPQGESIEGVILGTGDNGPVVSPLLAGALPVVVPAGDYHFADAPANPELAALAWGLGSYAFRAYQSAEPRGPRRLKAPAGVAVEETARIAAAIWLGRDLINTPANDLGPAELEAAVRDVAEAFGAEIAVTTGDDLIAANFPLLHAVGRGSARQPRMIDLRWGTAGPKLTIIGKGICFDTGGLNIKPGVAMALMKKDMGGAATALALAIMIMGGKLPVQLRLLIPAAENSISGNSFRPSDIITSRAGIRVEVGDTDAEGRLVLADALALADTDAPDYLMTFATLTGAARVALGPDLPPLYSTDDDLAGELVAAGLRLGDPTWQMPFWQPYDSLLESKVGELNSIFAEPFAGSIMAALFLKRFVRSAKRYTHFDIYGWTPRPQPGKPYGGEAQCARAVYDVLKTRLKTS